MIDRWKRDNARERSPRESSIDDFTWIGIEATAIEMFNLLNRPKPSSRTSNARTPSNLL